MKTQADIAADLASAAAMRIEVDGELSTSARTAKRTARDQLLEAAYNLKTGNVPVRTSAGFLVKSKSSAIGKLVSLKMGEVEIVKVGEEYVLVDQDGVIRQVAEPIMEFYAQSGKTYLVNDRVDTCTCGGAAYGKTCWHLCAVEFWLEASFIRRRPSYSTIHQEVGLWLPARK